ncbi:MAG: DUF4212 domain-containing protein [Lewinellaceae bacterium]|nr:DUF4212 domain-containing protein [Lewinellaceae bacterium]
MKKKKYWQKTIKLLVVFLSIWFIISILCSIVFVGQLNAARLGGFPLGFWFAMQGAMILFVLMIFIYIRLMNRLDKKFEEETGKKQNPWASKP